MSLPEIVACKLGSWMGSTANEQELLLCGFSSLSSGPLSNKAWGHLPFSGGGCSVSVASRLAMREVILHSNIIAFDTENAG
jgi:hypothetical protein